MIGAMYDALQGADAGIAEVQVLDAALLKAGNEALLALETRYILNRYGWAL
jgi:hypothetical protein